MVPRCSDELFTAILRSTCISGSHGAVNGARRRGAAAAPGLSSRALGLLVTPAVGRARWTRRRGVQGMGMGMGMGASERGYATKASNPTRSKPAATASPGNDHDNDNSNSKPPRRIAVLGGGMTGLTTAHYLARHAKNAHITLYEASGRLGGWLHGDTVSGDLTGGADVLRQYGPRMLRTGATSVKYDDMVLYDVVASLGLADKLLFPEGAANARYIYYPDHLVKLPADDTSLSNLLGAAWSFLTEPLWAGCLGAWIHYKRSVKDQPEDVSRKFAQLTPEEKERMAAWRQELRDKHWEMDDFDESVGHFLQQLGGGGEGASKPVQNIVSAMLHGIYGGDVWKLSARHTVVEPLFHQKLWGRVPEGIVNVPTRELTVMRDITEGPNWRDVAVLAERAADKKLIAFEDGLLTLVNSLKDDLEKQPNVTIEYNAPVTTLSSDNKEGGVHVRIGDKSDPVKYDHVISTLFSGQLARITSPANSLPALAETHAVTIMVVSLWYPKPDLLKANPGFGYLIPQSVSKDLNPECALGVLFDSCLETRAEVPGTKLTVMMGGHYWDGLAEYPTEEAAIQMAKNVVARHLGIDEDDGDVLASAKLCRECLPQHHVGHRARMRRAHHELLSTFRGLVTVAGPSYTSVGVVPAMRAGFDAAMRVARGHGSPWFHLRNKRWDIFLIVERARNPSFQLWDFVGATGLEWATIRPESRVVQTTPKSHLPFRQWTSAQLRMTDENGNLYKERLEHDEHLELELKMIAMQGKKERHLRKLEGREE